MPIRRYLEQGVVFTPEALSSMGKALEETTEILGISSIEANRRDVARFIIRLAQEDDTLDAAALRDRTVAALGGVRPSRNPSALKIPRSAEWPRSGGFFMMEKPARSRLARRPSALMAPLKPRAEAIDLVGAGK
jgi:hypothetical protein